MSTDPIVCRCGPVSGDIAARLRADALWFGNVPKHNKVHINADKVPRFAAKLSEAADEIERLRTELVNTTNKLTAERDEARRLWCVDIGELYSSSSQSLAKERGWDCFKENSDDGRQAQ